MNAHRLLIATLAVALAPLLLYGQDEESLYIPPTLVVSHGEVHDHPAVIIIGEDAEPQITPLLPVLFFDHPGDPTIPSRYRLTTDARDYSDTADVWPQIDSRDGEGALRKYYELLDVIGYRMTHLPAATITLRPGYSAEPGETPDVATTRADAIRDYLVATWRIDTHRIAIAPPELLSRADDILPHHQEARRVLIETASWELIRPVRYHARKRLTSSQSLRFLLTSNLPPDQVAMIGIVMSRGDAIVGCDSVPVEVLQSRYVVDGTWRCTGCDPRTLEEPVGIEATLLMKDGGRRSSNRVIIAPQEGRQLDPNVERTELLLPFFGFRDSTLNDYHRLMLREIIDAVAPTGRVIVETTSHGEYLEDTVDDPLFKEARYRQAIAERIDAPPISQRSFSHGTLRITSSSSAPGAVHDDFYELPPIRRMASWRVVSIDDPASHPFYALPFARTTAVISFIRDSLGITIANEKWDNTGLSLQDVRGTDSHDDALHDRPEHRLYGRFVRVRLMGEDLIRFYERSRVMRELIEKPDVGEEK